MGNCQIRFELVHFNIEIINSALIKTRPAIRIQNIKTNKYKHLLYKNNNTFLSIS